MSQKRKHPKKTLNITDALLLPPLTRGHGKDPAIICGNDVVTYEMLVERANRAGNAFRRLGVGVGERVLMIVRDTPAFFYAYLGLMKIGAVPVALNLRLSLGDLAYVIEDSESRNLLIDREFLGDFDGLAERVGEMPRVILADQPDGDHALLGDLMEGASPELEAVRLGRDDPAFWVYSSGTTGQPKGVVHTQKMIFGAEYFLGEVIGVGRRDRVFCTSKLFFAYTLGHVLISTLALGATAVLYPDWPDAEAIAEVIERHHPSVVLSVPTFYRNLLRVGATQRTALKDVRCYISAGEKLPVSLFEQWHEATGRPIIEGIGASETIYLFLANHPDEYRAGYTGRPTPETEVKMMDLSGNLISEPGVPGILWVRLAGNAKGYWKQKKKTRAAFREGWYCTSDMFVRDADDWYEYQGRSDDMLKISGQWVSPAEIEEVAQADPGIAHAAIVGVVDRDGLVRIALFMVPDDPTADREALEASVQTALSSQLAVYKCPRRVYFIDEMPLTGSGKLRRFQLRQLAEQNEAMRAA